MSEIIPNTDSADEIVEAPALTLEDAKAKFTEFLEQTNSNNLFCIQDRKYFDGDQLSASVRAELSKRGQPAFVNNKIAPAISGVLGLIDSGDSDPQAYPRTPEAADAADVATKLLRYMADKTDLPETLNSTSKEFVVEGSSAVVIEGGPDYCDVVAIPWNEFFYDPQSIRHDFKDARYLGFSKMLDADFVAEQFPETYKELGNPFDTASMDFDDREIETKSVWLDPKRKRLRVVELYYVDGSGQWHRLTYCTSGFLDHGPVEYVDDEGNSICPIEAVSYEITRDKERYGLVRNMVPLQDEINARRSRALHLINNRQVRKTDQMAPDANAQTAKEQAAKADGVLPFGYEIIPTTDLSSGQMSLLSQSLSDMDRLAPTPAVLGRTSGANESGRSRQILQQAGFTELARAIGRFEKFEQRIYKQMWFRARQYFTKQMHVRVTSDHRTPEFITVNEPILGLVPQPVVNPMTGEPMLDAYGQPMVQMVEGIVDYNNRIAQLDMDITIERVPDVVSMQQEAFAEILRFAASAQMSPLQPEFAALFELSGIPNTRQILEKLEAIRNESAEQQQMQLQMQAQKAALEGQEVQAEIAKDLAKADKDKADAMRTMLENDAIAGAATFGDDFGQGNFPDF